VSLPYLAALNIRILRILPTIRFNGAMFPLKKSPWQTARKYWQLRYLICWLPLRDRPWLGWRNVAGSYDDNVPYTPAWQEKITGVKRQNVIAVGGNLRLTPRKPGAGHGDFGAGINHWYHMDMNYRGIINMLMMCGCIGQSGGGWAHYVGQEKLRPQTGWFAAGICPGLETSATANEQHVIFLQSHQPMALRKT